ncbi:DegT/DnrJ/EryC1/StrS family aminotransferase [candidate division KSB1 bacterium]|nr:DegT/DnrJ/EryC1/StrS family aminotransferase [candidate division KSB1 bacterium]NIR72958.1 DegT/DnrJ/EryC1/StrS family aminotransferase [candidate division KSB1 bacterium]NIS25175.1 DegT/DnrJ/EryC1/StrS family aminotransferase [candidate division KSB1 bacterium]NIT72078.1 DegT/DnrJ/EryC1/StrS family aminotransferase [candidate division KSB1 bacterium]NIU25878.1 DegT/DnrJ/EryC1/StrS family aminotransferase [candidate division KSB1 bacterium]
MPAVIPLVDLKAQYHGLRAEIKEAIDRVLERGDFILGEELSLFESEFADFCGTEYAIGCGSGTDALHLACRALGIGPEDQVIMPAFTFVATALGVSLSGAKPVLVDVDPQSALIDLDQIERAITSKTRAIIPVHLYGQCVDMAPLIELAREHGLYIIEDAAQAHGAEYRGKRVGSLGDIGCFSFYPGKNLGAYGDGGMITVDKEGVADKLCLLRNWGSHQKYHHEEPGLNSRLDTIQAAILRVKLQYLEKWNNSRKKLAFQYTAILKEINGIQLTENGGDSVYHLYVIRLADRDLMLNKLRDAGIQAGIHYPFAVHELNAYKWMGYSPGAFPVAESWARQCLSLPIYAEMPEEVSSTTAEILKQVMHN